MFNFWRCLREVALVNIQKLREALDEEQRQAEKRDSVAPLLSAALQRLNEATKAARMKAVKRAAEGEEVDPNEPDPEVTQAQASVDLYREALQMAELGAARAASAVSGLFRDELGRRARVAQAAEVDAKLARDLAWKTHRAAVEAAAQATGAWRNLMNDDLPSLFQKEIAECYDTPKAKSRVHELGVS